MFKDLVFKSVDEIESKVKELGYEVIDICDSKVQIIDKSYTSIYNLYLMQVSNGIVLI